MAILVGCGALQPTPDDLSPPDGVPSAAPASATVSAPVEEGSPLRAFPQHTPYAAGSIRPDHITQEEMDRVVAQTYDEWKTMYIRQGCDEGRYYLHTNISTGGGSQTISISEGHGYGMVITALMAGHDPEARTIFDGMVLFLRDHPSSGDPALMAWNQVEGCTDLDGNGTTASATDGDMDIAYALLLADAQWGSDGAVNYRDEAVKTINAIMAQEVNPASLTLQLGDWVNLDNPVHYHATRSSDWMIGHLRAFLAATGDQRWQQVIDNTYATLSTIQTNYSPATGLLPDFVVDTNASPHPADSGFLEGDWDGRYSYNACRFPWRIGTDFMINGEARAKAALAPFNAWIQQASGGDPARIDSGYALDGSMGDQRRYTDLSFVAPIGVSAMAGAENQQWLNSLWDFIVARPVRDGGYYDNTLKMMSLIVISGNWWQP
jgi:endo-1,4-beta-D-glucanase Y